MLSWVLCSAATMMAPQCRRASKNITAASRYVYLDIGANWANTLRLHDDIGCHPGATWETFAFEPSPLIWRYLEEFTRWLNGDGQPHPKRDFSRSSTPLISLG